MQKGEHYGTYKDLMDEEIYYWTNEGMIWDYEEYKKNNKPNSKPKNKSLIDKYTDTFNGDKEKAELVVINRSITIYERKGQKEPATWVYEKYGT